MRYRDVCQVVFSREGGFGSELGYEWPAVLGE